MNFPDVKSVEGEAQIVLARGKKRFIYDFTVVLNFEVKVQDTDNPLDGGLTKEKGRFYCPSFVALHINVLQSD